MLSKSNKLSTIVFLGKGKILSGDDCSRPLVLYRSNDPEDDVHVIVFLSVDPLIF